MDNSHDFTDASKFFKLGYPPVLERLYLVDSRCRLGN